jgi:MFS transporter, AAHS family, 4-hydroxybenzoate transporter
MASDTVNVTRLLDESRVGKFQIGVFVLCGLVALLDGFDNLAIGFTAAPIASSLHLDLGVLGQVFAMAQFGFIIGSFVLAPLGDRLGRKWVLVAAILLMGAFTLYMVRVASLTDLLFCRLMVGVAVGVTTPLFVSLGADYAPMRMRGLIVTAFWVGIPLGGVIAGLLSASFIPQFGWQSIYWVGGTVPIVIAAALIIVLPESMTFLVTRGGDPKRIQKILLRVVPHVAIAEHVTYVTDERKLPGVPVKHLFTDGRAVPTLLLWGAFFADFLVLFISNSWPATLLRQAGIPVAQAAIITTFYSAGGIIGTLAVGPLVDKFGPYRVLVIGVIIGAVSTGSLGFAASSFLLASTALLVAGITIGGVGVGLVVLASTTYPTAIRSSGVGWGLGIARCGGVVGPLLAGALVANGWKIESVFVASAAPALLAGVCMLLLRSWRASREIVHVIP